MIEEVNKRKWMALYAFLIMDVVQILLVSVLYVGHPIFVLGFDFANSDPIISVSLFVGISLMQIIMLYVTASSMLRQDDLTRLYPEYDEATDWRSRYSRDDLVKWTQELAKQSKVEVNKIFIMNSPLPNAFTFSLPFMGSVVVVHTNTLEVLNEDEVKTRGIAFLKFNKDVYITIGAKIISGNGAKKGQQTDMIFFAKTLNLLHRDIDGCKLHKSIIA